MPCLFLFNHSSHSTAQLRRSLKIKPLCAFPEAPSQPTTSCMCVLSHRGTRFSLCVGLSQPRKPSCAYFSTPCTHVLSSFLIPPKSTSSHPRQLASGALYTVPPVLVWTLIVACFVLYGNHLSVSLSTPVHCALCDVSAAIRGDTGEAQENKVSYTQVLEAGGTAHHTGYPGTCQVLVRRQKMGPGKV